MNPLWLILIIPASASIGAAVMALMVTAKRADEEMLEFWEEDDG